MVTNRRRRVPKGFQQLNDFFNMGKWKWETGKIAHWVTLCGLEALQAWGIKSKFCACCSRLSWGAVELCRAGGGF